MSEQKQQELDDVPGWDAVAAARQVEPLRPEVLASVQSAVAHAVRDARAQQAVGGSDEPTVVRGLRRSRRRMVLAGVAAGAVAAALAVTAVVAPGRDPGRTTAAPGASTSLGAVSDAADFLDGVAQLQTTAPNSVPRYWRIQIKETHAGSRALDLTEWLSRSGVDIEVDGQRHHKAGAMTWPVGLPGTVDWTDLYRLPTRPEALKSLFSRGGAFGGVAVQQIADLLGESPAPTALRAALYRVLAGIPEVRLAGSVKDSLGRTGQAVDVGYWVMEGVAEKERLIIDPHTGTLLERLQIAQGAGPADPNCAVAPGNPGHCKPAFHAGETVESITYVSSAPVSSIG